MSQNADSSSSASNATTEGVMRVLAGIPYARQIGACLHKSRDEPGIVLRLPFQQRLVGNTHLSAFHGGVIGSFMQITAMVSAIAELGERRPPKLIDFSIDYLSFAGPRDLFARCKFQRVGRRVAAVSICCWQEDESAPVAVARAHLYVGETAAD